MTSSSVLRRATSSVTCRSTRSSSSCSITMPGARCGPRRRSPAGKPSWSPLALALALGRLSKRSLHLRTLFVDEGFGSLDADSVDPVIDALRSLADGGVQVGLISHVRGIAERLPARVEVVKSGQTSSIRVVRA